jgi:hypothetical protein
MFRIKAQHHPCDFAPVSTLRVRVEQPQIRDTARRLGLVSKGNWRTIEPSSDWTSKDPSCSMIFIGA